MKDSLNKLNLLDCGYCIDSDVETYYRDINSEMLQGYSSYTVTNALN